MILDEAEAVLDPVAGIEGFVLGCLVDASTGMILAARKDQDDISVPAAAAGAADIANVLSLLAGELPADGLEDVMVTFRSQLYIVRSRARSGEFVVRPGGARQERWHNASHQRWDHRRGDRLMPALRKGSPSVEDKVRAELQLLRAQVAEVRGSLAATSDGLVVAHDVPDVEPSQIAAIAAATLALASRATLATGCGTLREAVARGSDGYLAVYAAGDSAIVAVMGTSGLNVGMLQYRVHEIIDRIAEFSTQTGAWAAPARREPVRPGAGATTGAATGAADGQARQEGRASGRASLPRRRPAAS